MYARLNYSSFHHWHPWYNFTHRFHFSIHCSWNFHYRPYFIRCLHTDFINILVIIYIKVFIYFELLSHISFLPLQICWFHSISNFIKIDTSIGDHCGKYLTDFISYYASITDWLSFADFTENLQILFHLQKYDQCTFSIAIFTTFVA